MPFFVLFIAVLAFVGMWLYSKADRQANPDGSYGPREWFSAGGVLGAAIFLARFMRVPFVSVLSALPFILPYLKSAEQSQAAAGSSYMSRREAALILGVAEDASAEQVRDAHRRLIAKNHPDKGGSEYLAAKINQARDVLLG